MRLTEYIVQGVRHRRDPFYAKYVAGRRVLDVGCGRGEFLARDARNAVGIDVDPALVESCRAQGFDAYCMSAMALDFADGSFEAVHAAQLIEHFSPPDAVRFLGEVARVLRPGGYVLLTTPGVRNVWNTFSHIRPYPPTAFRKLLSSDTENYLREGAPRLAVADVQGSRFYFRCRTLNFASSVIDFLLPPENPIGWTIVLRRI